jgi:hypothetical protein
MERLRQAAAALAQAARSQPVKVQAEPATASDTVPTQSEPASPRRLQAHYLWAVLIDRIYEVFPLLARGPPLWDASAQVGEDGHAVPDWDLVGQPAPDYEVDQRVSG